MMTRLTKRTLMGSPFCRAWISSNNWRQTWRLCHPKLKLHMESGREFSSSDGARDVRFVNGDPLIKFVVPSNQAQEIVPNGTVGGIENVEISQWNGYYLGPPTPNALWKTRGDGSTKKDKDAHHGTRGKVYRFAIMHMLPPFLPEYFPH